MHGQDHSLTIPTSQRNSALKRGMRLRDIRISQGHDIYGSLYLTLLFIHSPNYRVNICTVWWISSAPLHAHNVEPFPYSSCQQTNYFQPFRNLYLIHPICITFQITAPLLDNFAPTFWSLPSYGVHSFRPALTCSIVYVQGTSKAAMSTIGLAGIRMRIDSIQ